MRQGLLILDHGGDGGGGGITPNINCPKDKYIYYLLKYKSCFTVIIVSKKEFTPFYSGSPGYGRGQWYTKLDGIKLIAI